MGKILVYKKSNFLFKHRNVNSYIFFKSKFLQKKKKKKKVEWESKFSQES